MGDTLFLAEGIEAAITSTNGIDPSQCINLLDRNKNTLWISEGTGSLSIWFDLGEVRICSAIALINNNSYTGGSAVDDSWNYWRLESSATWKGSTTVRLSNVTPISTDEPYVMKSFTEFSAQYVKLYIQDCLVDVSKIGTLLLGTPFEPPFPYSRPRRYRSQYGTEMIETKGGIRYSNLLHDERLIWNSINYDAMPTADMDNFLDQLWRQCKGCHYPFLFQDVDDSLHWVRANIGGALDYEEAKNQLWSTGITLEQEF